MLTLVAAVGFLNVRMSQPGEDRQTRSQSRALSFTTPGGDFETSTSPTRTEVMTDFVQAEERRAQREEARVQREEERRQEDQKRYEDERRFAQEQQQRWLDALQNAGPRAMPPPAGRADPSLPKLTLQKFSEETDNMSAYLSTFETMAEICEWLKCSGP